MALLHARIGTFRQLEILLAVYQEGSITQASKALFLTQPTVSMQLKKLADAVGAPLYDQVGKKLVFNATGLEVVRCAREVMDSVERLDMKLADMKGLKRGTLRLAVVTTAKYFIPHLLGEFLKQYPTIDFELNVGNRQAIIDRMENGEDDFYVFSHPPQTQDLVLHEFLSNPLVAIAPEGHSLANRKQIPLQTFIDQSYLFREHGSGTRHAIERHLENQGVQVNSRITIESNEAIKHAVMSGLGVTILSSHTLAFGGNAGLIQLDVESLPIVTRWYLANLRSKQLSVVAQAFLNYISQEDTATLLEEALSIDGLSECE